MVSQYRAKWREKKKEVGCGLCKELTLLSWLLLALPKTLSLFTLQHLTSSAIPALSLVTQAQQRKTSPAPSPARPASLPTPELRLPSFL